MQQENGAPATPSGSHASHEAADASSPSVSIPSAVADVLERAADLVEPEGAWTQEAYARTASRTPLGWGAHPSAVCWCALGAIDAQQAGPIWARAAYMLADAVGAKRTRFNSEIGAWNDAPHRTQAEVVAKLREAAALAREQGL